MTNRDAPDRRVAPPGRHQLAVMIWLCVFPTLTAINLLFGDWLRTLSSVPRTFVLATIAVPVVMYGLMPRLHRLRGRLVTGSASRNARHTQAAPGGRERGRT